MLYTPVPGTPLYAEHQAKGTLLSSDEMPDADVHGQLRFNFRHPRIQHGEETEYLLRAFRRDFERERARASTRIARTLLRGWLTLRRHPDRARARARGASRRRTCGRTTRRALGLRALVRRPARARGAAARDAPRDRARVRLEGADRGPHRRAGRLLALWLEDRRLRRGVTYEPRSFYDVNPAAAARPELVARGAAACRWVEPSAVEAAPAEAVA